MKRALTMAVALGLATGLAAAADAHPVDEVVQAAYLSIEPTQVRLELDVTPGPAVSATVLRDLDRDGDGRITPREARAFALALLRRLPLTSDGRRAPWRLDQIGVPAYAGLRDRADVLRLLAAADRRESAGEHVLTLADGYRPASGPVMINVFPRSGPVWTYRIVRQERSDDGRRYRVSLDAAFAGARRESRRARACVAASPAGLETCRKQSAPIPLDVGAACPRSFDRLDSLIRRRDCGASSRTAPQSTCNTTSFHRIASW